MNELRTGKWYLKDLDTVKKLNYNVFSCFHCGGGSSMGYKLAGLNVLGGVEIDSKMMHLYRENFNPKHSYLLAIQEFKKLKNIPKELYNLDILDGSPPCSNFSVSGKREENWGKAKHYAEGDTTQLLENLFFDFIDVAKLLQPKIIVAENVKGLITGNAKGFVKEIIEKFKDINYDVQLFLLNASKMGVPQKRERIFFLAKRKDLKLSNIKLDFNEKEISAKEAIKDIPESNKLAKSKTAFNLWAKCRPGEAFENYHIKGSCFNQKKINGNKPANTVTARSISDLYHWNKFRNFTKEEFIRFQTFPEDYQFCNKQPVYVMGMSVPPFMIQRIATEIINQWLSKLD
tara:strand:- start:2243 stop:3277 length:1035 start_codon:yes stop_codon:yes gene_type:complete